MPYEERKPLIRAVEQLRRWRTLVCFLNFDRAVDVPTVPGLSTQFQADAKECLFRVLKESPAGRGIDLFMYSRGGDTNAVWPVVSLIREFDPDFQVIVPFRCHSSGTLLALGAQRIWLSALSELSPIDPTTGNQFNPPDPSNPKNPQARLGISVEDVTAYKLFVKEQLTDKDAGGNAQPIDRRALTAFMSKLFESMHPLALGNVHRVVLQIAQLAAKLLNLHPRGNEDVETIIKALTTKFYSHVHMINRHEAQEILGNRVAFMPPRLAVAVDRLLRAYEDDFKLRRMFFVKKYLGNNPEVEVRFIGGACESRTWSYLFSTRAKITQRTQLPPNVQVQIPPGQNMPLIAGLPVELTVEVSEHDWVHNLDPQGVTV